MVTRRRVRRRRLWSERVRVSVRGGSKRVRIDCSFVVVKRQRIGSVFVLVHNEIWDKLFL